MRKAIFQIKPRFCPPNLGFEKDTVLFFYTKFEKNYTPSGPYYE